MATLKIQKVSEFVSALSKMQEYDICLSGFPKKGRQGSHISKRTHNFLTRCTSFWSIFHSNSYAIVKILGNLFWAKSKLWAASSSSEVMEKAANRARPCPSVSGTRSPGRVGDRRNVCRDLAISKWQPPTRWKSIVAWRTPVLLSSFHLFVAFVCFY